MTLVAKIDGVTLPDGALLIGGGSNTSLPGGVQGLPTSAWYGESLSGGLQLDDPDGDLDSVVTLEGLHTFTVDETACVGKERIWSGWLTARRISRGPYKDGPGRVWDVDIIDMNWAFALMVFRAKSAQRPAESDLVRVAFGLASGPMSFTPVHDNGRFNTTDNPTNFEDANYVARYPIELFATTAVTSGKNVYAYWDHDEDEISAHYDLIGVGPTSTLAISNVIADSDSTTFYPFLDGSLDRSPAWKVTGILFGYRGAYAYGTRQLTIDELSPSEFSPVEMQRDEVYSTDRVGKLATAQALITRMLAERAVDKDTVQTMIRVPASQVNLVEAGDLIDAKFTHLPGYEAGGLVPVIRRNVVPTAGRTDMYDIHLELTSAARAAGPGGGPGTDFPPPTITCDVADIVIVQSQHDDVTSPSANPAVDIIGASWPAPPTAGNLLICAWMSFGQQGNEPGTMAGWTQIAAQESFNGVGGSGGTIAVFWKIADSSEDTTPTALGGDYHSSNLANSNQYLIEVAGVSAIDVFAVSHSETESSTPGFTITPTAGTTGIAFTFQEVHSNIVGTLNGGETVLYVEGNITGGGNPGRWIAYEVFDAVAGAVDVNRHFTGGTDRSWAQLGVAFICTGSDPDAPCVEAGQPSPEDEPVTPAPDGVETTFNTRCPFADGTLHVYVDNTDQTGAITSYDGAAGEFTLGFAPTVTERITAFYLGR